MFSLFTGKRHCHWQRVNFPVEACTGKLRKRIRAMMAIIGSRILKGLCPEFLASFQHPSKTINLCGGNPKNNVLFFLQIAILVH